MQVTSVGLDIAKHWFQVHGVGPSGQVVVRRKLRRSEVLAFFQSLPRASSAWKHVCSGAPLGARADSARTYG